MHGEASFRFCGPACAHAPEHRRQTWQGSTGLRLKSENRKDALTADGRGTRKELGMPVADGRARLKNRRGTLHLHQHHHGSRHRDGRRRVHRDAQRAMVGIPLQRDACAPPAPRPAAPSGQDTPPLPAKRPAYDGLVHGFAPAILSTNYPCLKNTQNLTRKRRSGMQFGLGFRPRGTANPGCAASSKLWGDGSFPSIPVSCWLVPWPSCCWRRRPWRKRRRPCRSSPMRPARPLIIASSSRTEVIKSCASTRLWATGCATSPWSAAATGRSCPQAWWTGTLRASGSGITPRLPWKSLRRR